MQSAEQRQPTTIPGSSVANRHERDTCVHGVCSSRKKQGREAKWVHKCTLLNQYSLTVSAVGWKNRHFFQNQDSWIHGNGEAFFTSRIQVYVYASTSWLSSISRSWQSGKPCLSWTNQPCPRHALARISGKYQCGMVLWIYTKYLQVQISVAAIFTFVQYAVMGL